MFSLTHLAIDAFTFGGSDCNTGDGGVNTVEETSEASLKKCSFFKIYFYFMCIGILPACVCVRELDPLELELQIVVCRYFYFLR